MAVLLSHRGYDILIDAEDGDWCRWEIYQDGYVQGQPAQSAGSAPTFRKAVAAAKAEIDKASD